MSDNYTSISHRGKACVDYFVCRHEDLDRIDRFEVLNLTDFITNHNLMQLAQNKVSDHSSLVCNVKTAERAEGGGAHVPQAVGCDQSLPN